MNICPHCQRPTDETGTAVDVDLRVFTVDGVPYSAATGLQARVLAILVKRMNKIVSRDSLLTLLYSDRTDCDWPGIKITDVYVCKLRKVLKDTPLEIENVWGVGYRLRRRDVQLHSQPVQSPGSEGARGTLPVSP